MIGNHRRSKLFEQDDDVTKKVHLEVAEFYGKLNPTSFLDWIMLWKITLVGMQYPKIKKFVL